MDMAISGERSTGLIIAGRNWLKGNRAHFLRKVLFKDKRENRIAGNGNGTNRFGETGNKIRGPVFAGPNRVFRYFSRVGKIARLSQRRQVLMVKCPVGHFCVPICFLVCSGVRFETVRYPLRTAKTERSGALFGRRESGFDACRGSDPVFFFYGCGALAGGRYFRRQPVAERKTRAGGDGGSGTLSGRFH